MSKTRSISFSRATSSQNQGLCQSIGWRTGESRLPSRSLRRFFLGGEGKKKGTRIGSPSIRRAGLRHRVEGLLEATGMALLGLRQSLEPVGDLAEAFLARGPRHARIHVGIFVRLARDRGLEVVVGRTDRQAGRRIATHLEELEMAVRVAGFAFRGRAEDDSDIVVAFDIGLLGEIEIAAVGLALAGKGRLQIAFSLRSFEIRHLLLLRNEGRSLEAVQEDVK